MPESINRRRFLKQSALVSTAALAVSLEEQVLLANQARPAPQPATDGKGLPVGKIGNLSVSRLFTGGNLISGFAHSRDLMYVSSLLNNYFTDEKVMAAGAIKPREAFRFAYEGGADFICAGMFDFQVREDVLIARDLLAANLNRQRPWCG